MRMNYTLSQQYIHSFICPHACVFLRWQVLHPPLKHITSAWLFVFNEFRLLLPPLSLPYTCFLYLLYLTLPMWYSTVLPLLSPPLYLSLVFFSFRSNFDLWESSFPVQILHHYLIFLHTLRRI